MIAYTFEAEAQVDALRVYYVMLGRIEAVSNLQAALRRAEQRIDISPASGLAAPRPYPALAREGRRWIKEGRYWIAYSPSAPATIVGVFFETADLPSRT